MTMRRLIWLSVGMLVLAGGCQYEPSGDVDDQDPDEDTAVTDTVDDDGDGDGGLDAGDTGVVPDDVGSDTAVDTGLDAADGGTDAVDSTADIGETGPTCPSTCGTDLSNVEASSCTDGGGCDVTCRDGFKDCDGVVKNGCEYDVRSEAAFDRCDDAVFVSAASGSDDDSGLTPGEPVATLNHAISIAARHDARSRVLVGNQAPYPVDENREIELESGVSLLGGYDPSANWKRDVEDRSVISPTRATGKQHQRVLVADELDEDLTVEGFRIDGPYGAPGTGMTMYGLWVVDSGDHLTVKKTRLMPGAGGDGADGEPGAAGAPGGEGRPAREGTGGRGGASACGAGGGDGGDAVKKLDGTGDDGADGASPGAAQPGRGGDGGKNGGDESNDPKNGKNGNPGNDGDDGDGGDTGTDVFGSFDDQWRWQPDSGTPPTKGDAGAGGGGGGAGGSFKTEGGSIQLGGGGGGGGAGGCGGRPGENGQPGGGSFGIVVVDSTVTLEATTIVTAPGGDGGDGAPGGDGGSGGNGGSKQKRDNNSAKPGGDGKSGGNGGDGGGGAGGCGGPSVGIAKKNGSVQLDSSSNIDNSHAQASSGGTGDGDVEDGCQGVKRDEYGWE